MDAHSVLLVDLAPARRLAGWGLASAAFVVLVVGVVLGLYAMFSKPS
ncbi:MAG: hypothetical protein QOI54_2711 [Actinomycetota bacterium]|jgi:hypothetical protein|nr:hypothetical protein [Actinomycetota bacterium]